MTSQSQLLLKAKGYHNTLTDNFIQNHLPDSHQQHLAFKSFRMVKPEYNIEQKSWWNVLETTEVTSSKIKTNRQRRKLGGELTQIPAENECHSMIVSFSFEIQDSLWHKTNFHRYFLFDSYISVIFYDYFFSRVLKVSPYDEFTLPLSL